MQKKSFSKDNSFVGIKNMNKVFQSTTLYPVFAVISQFVLNHWIANPKVHSDHVELF